MREKCTYQLQTAAHKSLCCGNPEWESRCRKEEYLSRYFYHYLLCSFSLIRVSVPIKSLFLNWVIYSAKDVGESWYADKVHIVFLGCLYKSRFCSKTSFVFTNQNSWHPHKYLDRGYICVINIIVTFVKSNRNS